MKNKNKNEKFVWGGFHPFSYHPVIFHLVPDLKGKKILDCGCGKGIWGYLIRAVRSFEGSTLIGIDIDKDYLNFCRTHKVYNKLVQSSVTKLPVSDGSVGFLICSEVIEHLSKKRGTEFLNEVDRAMDTGGRAIITTPNMNVETKISSGKDSHSSKWTIEDFQKRGYKVYGMGVKIPPGIGKWYTPCVLALGNMMNPISFKLPAISGFLIAVKDF